MTASTTPWPAPLASAPLRATVTVPGSKSLTARALLLAALAQAPSTLTGVLRSRDTDLMRAALRTLGARFTDLDATGTTVAVTPAPVPLHVSAGPDAHLPAGAVARIDVGLAGTVMRFLPPLLALADAPVLLDGDDAARLRPLAALIDALTAHPSEGGLGAGVTYLGEPGFLPLVISPAARHQSTAPVRISIDSSASSQFLSALLLAAPLLPAGACLTPTGAVPSLPHVAMTVEALRSAGCSVEEPGAHAPEGQRTWVVHPGQPRGLDTAIEPDLSNAGPFLAAALVAGGHVSVPHWPAATTQAGDAWRWLLPALGGSVTTADEAHGTLTLTAHGTGQLRGITADLSEVGELTPTVAALATLASAQGHASRLTGIGHLRGHETDRLAALVTEIRRLGGLAHETDDGLVIEALPARAALHGATLHSYADHRMATFAAVVGLGVEGVRVDDVACTSKTLPGFVRHWRTMLGDGEEL